MEWAYVHAFRKHSPDGVAEQGGAHLDQILTVQYTA